MSATAQFKTTFDFDGKYLWNGWRYQQAVYGVINCHPSRIELKIFVYIGPLTAKMVSVWMLTHSVDEAHLVHANVFELGPHDKGSFNALGPYCRNFLGRSLEDFFSKESMQIFETSLELLRKNLGK